jgi:hypothetical protein
MKNMSPAMKVQAGKTNAKLGVGGNSCEDQF